jgi:hypothetical protein
MLLRKPYAERWEPVSKELLWVLCGRQNMAQHQRLLPGYCYKILDLQKRTIFKAFKPISEVITIKDKEQAATCKSVKEVKQIMTIDWEKLGSVFAIGERSHTFFENEAEQKLKEDGLLDLTPEKAKQIHKLMIGEHWEEKKIAEIQECDPGKPVEEIIEKCLTALEETTKKAIPEWHQIARAVEPEAVTKFHSGVAKGSDEFLDKNGNLKGERKIKLRDTYEFLLTAWPEIEEMLKARPSKTRNDLWDWLTPFSYAGWIEITDLDQLNRLCDSIDLRLKLRGRPSKVK